MMRSFTLILMFISFLGSNFAQDVIINWVEDYSKTYNGDTVYAHSTGEQIYTDMYVINNGTSESFIWERKRISHSSQGFDDELCDDQLCHTPEGSFWTCPLPMPVANGDSTNLQPKLITNGVGGSGHHRYYILDQDEVLLDSVDVIFNSVLSSDEFNISNKDVSLYPNPSNGNINIIVNNAHSQNQEYNINLKDALGKVVYQATLKSNEKSNINDLNKGVYFAVVQPTNGGEVVTKKLVVR